MLGSKRTQVGSVGLLLLLVAKAIGFALEGEDVTAKGEAVQQGVGEAVIAQDPHPFTEGEVGGGDAGDPFAERSAELEEELGAGGGEWDVAQFVENDELMALGLFQEAGELMGFLGLLQGIDECGDWIESHPVVLSAGGQAQTDGDMGLAQAGIAQQDHWLGPDDPPLHITERNSSFGFLALEKQKPQRQTEPEVAEQKRELKVQVLDETDDLTAMLDALAQVTGKNLAFLQPQKQEQFQIAAQKPQDYDFTPKDVRDFGRYWRERLRPPGSLQRPLRRRSGRSPAWPYPPTAGRSLYLVHSALPILLKETAYRPDAPTAHPSFTLTSSLSHPILSLNFPRENVILSSHSGPVLLVHLCREWVVH